MVYPAFASSSLFVLLYFVGLLPYQAFATQPPWTELSAAEACNSAAGNRSLLACSNGSWSEPSTQQQKIPAQQFHGPFSSILDNPSLNLILNDEELTSSKSAFASMQVSGHVLDEYIVRFTVYKHASAHKKALQAALHLVSGWQWIDRINPAAAFPTDFALLNIEVAAQDSILGELKRLPFVKDVSVQSRFVRALMEDSETCVENEKGRGGSCIFSETSERSFPRKKGKQFTSWTEQGETVDCFDRPNIRRKILLQVFLETST
ncbi:hypothetical protein L7F22_033170 [Adiantum nelumboides]|nr:hypothetical protein [Adiantum nelumboides]